MPTAKRYLFEGEYRTAKEVSKIYTARSYDFCRKALKEGLTTIDEFNRRESINTAIMLQGAKQGAQTLRKMMHDNIIHGKEKKNV
jgi:hypothetical protein